MMYVKAVGTTYIFGISVFVGDRAYDKQPN